MSVEEPFRYRNGFIPNDSYHNLFSLKMGLFQIAYCLLQFSVTVLGLSMDLHFMNAH